MRRMVLICALMVGALMAVMIPANAAEPSRVITLNPLGFIFGAYNLNYESAINSRQSLVVSGSFIALKLSGWELSGLGAGAALRFYPRGTAPRGFYYGPVASVGAVSATYVDPNTRETYTGKGTAISVGGNAGFQWISNDGFTFDINAGASVGLGQVTAGGYTAPTGSVTPSIGLAIGYAW